MSPLAGCRLCLIVLLLFVHGGRLAAQEPRPNIVAILTDDQGRWAMGTYANDEVRTPNMDRIGREGAVFENAFTVTPVHVA
jgi:uncharacterized sulfatase